MNLVEQLAGQGQTVAVAESLTGGLLADSLVAIPGSSEVFLGGVVAYSPRIKESVLGVSEELIAAEGTVVAEVALQMARGVRELMRSDWGLGTTGVAGPGPAEGKPAGTAFVACVGPTGDLALGLSVEGDRGQVRRAVVAAAAHMLADQLAQLPTGGPA